MKQFSDDFQSTCYTYLVSVSVSALVCLVCSSTVVRNYDDDDDDDDDNDTTLMLYIDFSYLQTINNKLVGRGIYPTGTHGYTHCICVIFRDARIYIRGQIFCGYPQFPTDTDRIRISI